ncbi:hypothetical protein C5167_001284 [Papaver somniferum]|uniref:RING-type domain-containing protein n=1 Tax=Papaver somniferum TaxID=3469 RepID=A0A4Y7KY92_PAPSO|nr:hypothetical protein C5167_001284 [Papaver somniferum]
MNSSTGPNLEVSSEEEDENSDSSNDSNQEDHDDSSPETNHHWTPDSPQYQQPPLVEDEEARTESVRRFFHRTRGSVEATASSTHRIKVEPEDNNDSNTNVSRGDSNGSDDENVECCLICMNPYCYEGNHRVSCLPCGHVYGLSCIQRWIQYSKQTYSTCPVCKQKCSLENVIKLYSSPLLPLMEKGKEESLASHLEKLAHEMEEHFLKRFEEFKTTIYRMVSENQKEIVDSVHEFINRMNEQRRQEIEAKDKRIEELKMSLERQEMQIDQMRKRRKLEDPEPHHSPSECNEGSKCQLCMSDNHQALNCPFMNARCTMPNCDGIRMIQRSNTSDNPNRVYLRCQYAGCKYFEWMDDACKAATGCCVSSSASPIKYNSVSNYKCCFCGDRSHRTGNCPLASGCSENGTPSTE